MATKCGCPRGKGFLGFGKTLGRAQSYVRPFSAPPVAAGTTAVPKSDLNRNRTPEAAGHCAGCSDLESTAPSSPAWHHYRLVDPISPCFGDYGSPLVMTRCLLAHHKLRRAGARRGPLRHKQSLAICSSDFRIYLTSDPRSAFQTTVNSPL